MSERKRMTQLNPLIKPKSPLEYDESLLAPQMEDHRPKEELLRMMRENPEQTLKKLRKWLDEP
jgi:flagellar biosynthesis/type III secretory pathway M-ring protein FliF/YscJ